MAPTKELCNQITKDTKMLCKYASRNVNILDLAQSDDVDVLRQFTSLMMFLSFVLMFILVNFVDLSWQNIRILL